MWGSFNQNAAGSRNQNAAGSRNQNAGGSRNQNAAGSHNQNAGGSHNQNAGGSAGSGAGPAGADPASMVVRMGAGHASGAGFAGGYGDVARSDYATPAALAPIPWTLDFSAGNGWPAFPAGHRFKPDAPGLKLEWRTGDWDPGLRFWTLPFDPLLTEWLQDVDLASPAVMAAREFAGCHAAWQAHVDPAQELSAQASWIQRLIEPEDLQWRVWLSPTDSAADRAARRDLAWGRTHSELQALEDLLQDDRDRYLAEAAAQSDGLTDYFVHVLGIDPASKPWTMALLGCGSAIGNVLAMQYKATYKRVRPSTLCPGLVPPWGPPQHPAFPSGHSLVAHLYALLLLQIEPVAQRFGVFDDGQAAGRKPTHAEFFGGNGSKLGYGVNMRSPLLWLAWRAAKNRERIGVHYPSDSAASRRLAAALWQALFASEADLALIKPADQPGLNVPTLHSVLAKAQAEWPSPGVVERAVMPDDKPTGKGQASVPAGRAGAGGKSRSRGRGR